jgi:hypothetical protein
MRMTVSSAGGGCVRLFHARRQDCLVESPQPAARSGGPYNRSFIPTPPVLMQASRPPFRSLTALLLSIGLGLTIYYGQQWWQLPEYNDADIGASVELNLHLELQQRGPHLQPDAAGIERLREMIRQEVETEIRREREKIQLRFGIGLIALVLGGGQLAAGAWLRS